jgi:hypothetical protein
MKGEEKVAAPVVVEDDAKVRMQHAYRLGQMAMAARMFLKTGGVMERRELVALVNQELKPPYYEPVR